MFSLICVWINGWVNNREAGDLRRHRGHYDVIVMVHGVPMPAFHDPTQYEISMWTWTLLGPEFNISIPWDILRLTLVPDPHYCTSSCALHLVSDITLSRSCFSAITMTSYWARWCLKSPESRLFAQPFVQAQIKENTKSHRHWPLWRLTGGFPTKGQ